ncbi:YraN family protein [Psychrobacter sp. SWN149]|uniref:YraN family protein n=1 Tax=Psychrobacter sp. SWN149 TaxID=2792057 RepID=UPI0018CE8718|nr:YraN family protein [Psychrobacter sp. SWN149]MBH0007578.1 YraN family protein [Psychrobacter sp. SWN149]
MMCYDNYQMLIRPTTFMANHKPLTLTSPKQRQGSLFEQQACEFLQAKGLRLIAQNWQQPKVGELDLVMIETGSAWSTLVFIEVRQRKRSAYGDAAISITASKQRKVIKTAQCFLQQHPEYADYDCRFDVIAYNTLDSTLLKDDASDIQPEWIKGAFVARAW